MCSKRMCPPVKPKCTGNLVKFAVKLSKTAVSKTSANKTSVSKTAVSKTAVSKTATSKFLKNLKFYKCRFQIDNWLLQ